MWRVLECSSSAEMVEQAHAAGALDCVLKLSAARDLVPVVRAALRGERCTSSSIVVGRLNVKHD